MKTPFRASVFTCVLGTSLLSAGCGQPGERAGNNGDVDNCPEGEICSDKTPDGLRFRGPGSYLGGNLMAVAAGGRMQIEILDNSDYEPLAYESVARTSGQWVGVESQRTYVVDLRGVTSANGTETLRILDPETQELFDRVRINVSPISSIGVTLDSQEKVTAAEPTLRARPPALLAGGPPVTVNVSLLASDRRALYDGDLVVTASGATLQSVESSWNDFTVRDTRVGTPELTVTAGGTTRRQPLLPVVSIIDRLEASLASGTQLSALAREICFVPVSGNYNVGGTQWTFSSTGGIRADRGLYANCATLTSTAVGAASITAMSSGVSLTVELTVTAVPAPALAASADSASADSASADSASGDSASADSASGDSASAAGERAARQ